MIKGIAHICLAAKDLAAVERFYCGGLGMKKAFDFIHSDQVIGFYLEVCPGAYIEVFQQDAIDTQAKSPIMHLCLEVDDIMQVGQRLVENGHEATEKKLGADHSWQMWTTDPSGVRIEFHQYTAQSCQNTHENCLLT